MTKKEEFYQDIRFSLGDCLVDVELEDNHIDYAFRMAKKTFKQKGSNNFRKSFFKLPVDPSQRAYQLPTETSMVVNIVKPTFTFTIQDEFSLAAYNDLFGWKSTSTALLGDWLSYEMTLQSMELWRKFIAYEADFEFDEHRHQITFPKPPEVKTIWILECYKDLSDEEYMDVLWIQSWTQAEAKQLLGAAYRKFSQLPGPDGAVSLDGGSLIQEAKDEKRELLEDILNGVDGAPEAWGVYMG